MKQTVHVCRYANFFYMLFSLFFFVTKKIFQKSYVLKLFELSLIYDFEVK